MMLLETIFMQPFMQALGWALIHFIWQGALVALLLASALVLMRRLSAQARYTVATLGLLLMLAVPVITLSSLYRSMPAVASGPERRALLAANKGASASQASTPQSALSSQTDASAGAAKPARFASLEGLTDSRFAPLARLFALFWLAGILILSLRFFKGWTATARLKRRGRERAPAVCERAFARLVERMKVSPQVQLYKSVLVEVPTVIGWLRPVILVPVSAFTGLSFQQLEALLAHELAHVRRYDYLVNLLQAIAETLLFYHPAVWWVSKQIRAEREHACDDLAVEACGDALVYARALAELETLRVSEEGRLALAATGGSLIKRIRRLVQPPQHEEQRRPAWLAALTLCVTLSSALTLAQGAFFTITDPERLAADPVYTKREVAVTFVSLPYFRPGNETIESLDETTTKLLNRLAAHNIKAVGFVGGNMLDKEGQKEARKALLRRWLDGGHELGNQGYDHLSLFKTPLEEYKANVIRGEQVTRALMQERGRELRYYSYPFLNTGPDPETKRAFEQFLAEHGYTIHAVTIDNMDWIFSNAYQEARHRGDAEVMKRISDEYIAYMDRVFAHYEQLSMKVFGREIPQVLMLETSALNADNFDRLVEMLKRRGYSFNTMEEALKDRAYSEPTNYTGAWGISWIERWAIDKHVNISGDPVLPPYMQQFGKDGLSYPGKQ